MHWFLFRVVSDGGGDPCDPLNQPLVITNSATGEIQSPNYPSKYPNDEDCQWHIQVNLGYVVELTFLDFVIEKK